MKNTIKKGTHMILEQKKTEADLHIFLILIATLVTAGSLFIYSASSIYALERFGSPHYFLKKHLCGLLLSSIAFFVARLIPLALVKRASPYFFLGSLFLTMLTLFAKFGQHIHGSS